MSLNSVNTNNSAIVALQSLNLTATQLAATQKQVSTGYRVADAVDDGAAYAVAQRVRADVSALTSANQQLGNVQGMLSTTLSGLNNVSTLMNTMQGVLVKLADGNTQGSQRTQYQQQYTSDLANLKTFITDSTYNGKTLINSSAASGYGSINVVRNENGAVYTISQFDAMTSLYAKLTLAAGITAGAVAAKITATGAFSTGLDTVGTQLNNYGAATNYVSNQISFNSNKIDALNTGVGALVDANLAQEAAMLTSLQTRQQLGTQALSLANAAPQSLLSLFK
jgi:flagellin